MARMPSGLQEEGGARPAEQGHKGCPVPPKPPWRGAHEKSLQTCSPARTGRAGPELWLSGSQTRDRTAGRICPELGGGQGGALPLASVRDVWASPWTEAPSLGVSSPASAWDAARPWGPLLPRSTPLLLTGGSHARPSSGVSAPRPPRSSRLPVSPLAPLLPSFA